MSLLSTDNPDNRVSYCAAREDPLAHECVKGREYGQSTARSNCDQATAKLVGQCGVTTDELYEQILFSRHFKYLFSLCGSGESLTMIPRPEYDVAYAGKWCLNIGRLSLGPSLCQDSGTNMPTFQNWLRQFPDDQRCVSTATHRRSVESIT